MKIPVGNHVQTDELKIFIEEKDNIQDNLDEYFGQNFQLQLKVKLLQRMLEEKEKLKDPVGIESTHDTSEELVKFLTYIDAKDVELISMNKTSSTEEKKSRNYKIQL